MKILKIKYGYLITLLFLFLFATSYCAFAKTLMVTNVISNSVGFFNETTLQMVKEVKVGYMPHEVEVTADGKTAVVANFGDIFNLNPGHSLTILDVASGNVIKTIELPKKSRPHGVAILSDTEVLVTAQGIQSLLLVDFVTGNIIKTIPLPGAGAHMVLVDGENRFAYVANTDSGNVCKINLKNFTIEGDVKIGKAAEGLALTPEQDLLLVTNRKENYIAVLRTKDLSLQKQIATDKGPVRVVMFDHGRSALITNTESGNAQVIDMASLSITHTFKTTLSHLPLPVPVNIKVRDDQKTAYITNSFSGDITLVDLTKGQILKSFKSGYMPDGLAMSAVTITNDTPVDAEIFSAGPIDINANINDIWRITKQVEDYYRISHGAVTAHVEGDVDPGKSIYLELYKDKLIGKFLPKSTEVISVVDDNYHILSWIRQLPGGEYTERFQHLEKISENKTVSTIVLRIPGIVGKITKKTIGKVITEALTDLNNGIKEEAERFKR